MRRRVTKALVVASTCAVFATSAQTLGSKDFAVRLPLSTTHDGLHVVDLPEAVYRAAQTRDLADLRIFNAGDQALPIKPLPRRHQWPRRLP